MRLGLIKKSMVCILSLSFCAVLASCGNNLKVEKTSTKTIFNNADIQAYAKKYASEKTETPIVSFHDYKQADYTVISKYNIALLKNGETGKYQLYIRSNDKFIDLAVDESETITDVVVLNQTYTRFGYVKISYSTNKIMVIDFNGDVVIDKTEGQVSLNTNFRTYNVLYRFTGTIKFYDLFTITTTSGTTNVYYDVALTFNDGLISYYSLTKLDDESKIDYSRVVEDKDYTSLKEYNLYYSGSTLYAKDLKGNLTANTTLYANPSTYYALDDNFIYQTRTIVTGLDDYTYYEDGNFYILRTYSIDLKTGVQTELKDYKYVLNDIDYVYGYNQKDNRDYIAAVCVYYREIENKRLALVNESGMFDGKGNLISNKTGEKGYYLDYFNDRVYFLYDGINTSIIDNKGKVKYTYNEGRNVIVDRTNGIIFIPNTTSTSSIVSGRFVDSDLKIALEPRYTTESIYKTFMNGAFIYRYNSMYYLGKVVNGTLTTLDTFSKYYANNVSLVTSTDVDKTIICDDRLIQNNIYLVQTIVKDGEDSYYKVEIHSYDGTILQTYEHVTSLSYDASSVYFLKVNTTNGVYMCTTAYINNQD